MEESRLVEKARSGDVSAYEQLVREHQSVAFRTACLITSNVPEAEDAAQEAFVKAYRALHRFRSGAPFRPWLLAIVANEARNRRKASGRREGLALRVMDEPAENATYSPEATVVAAERHSELLQSLNTLGESDRVVISCRYFLELSEEETAAALGCARGTVKSRLSRALVKLRAVMKEEKDAG
ncbi:MAG: RNA polymerase sigma factor [Rubrobacteraceae bacterium]